MFDIDAKGLAELEGGRPAYRLALEAVSNVFDEYRGYGDESRRKPSYCAVQLTRSQNPRGCYLTVRDDGPGFNDAKDIFTLFGSTAKREHTGVAGRFNVGEKQLIASAVEATISTLQSDGTMVRVMFRNGRREVSKSRPDIAKVPDHGTSIDALMRWTVSDEKEVQQMLGQVLPPEGLVYIINGLAVEPAKLVYSAQIASLPTVKLSDGVLRTTTSKSVVNVVQPAECGPWLYELGIPVCNLTEIGFPYSLDVQQKVPVPMSRDMVETAYLYRLIGLVFEQAALDGTKLLTEEQQESGFVKDALNYVTRPEALQSVVEQLYGENVVRQSSDPIANAKAAQAGAMVIPGRWFGAATRKRLEMNNIMPTSKDRFGGAESIPGMTPEVKETICPFCGGEGKI